MAAGNYGLIPLFAAGAQTGGILNAVIAADDGRRVGMVGKLRPGNALKGAPPTPRSNTYVAGFPFPAT